MEATLFVFYAPRDPRARWTYAGLPAGWWQVGKGATGSARLPVDEQFCGPAATAAAARAYLETTFALHASRHAVRSAYDVPTGGAAL